MTGHCIRALCLFAALVTQAAAFEVNVVLRSIAPDQKSIVVFGGGQERTVDVSDEAKFLDAAGKPLAEGLKSPALKAGAELTLNVERSSNGRPLMSSLRVGHHAGGGRPGPGSNALPAKNSVGFKPLDEMTADDRYQGEDGGLYGKGQNSPPPAHAAAAKQASAKIAPLDATGKPSPSGKIGLISISMSNATQEFSRFKQVADADSRKSSSVAIVDCAQGGQAMAEWVDPQARPWQDAARRIEQAGVTPQQVQVAWIKLANKGPRGNLSEHGRQLQKDTVAVIHNAQQRFPNLRVVYLASRIYGGYGGSPLNPEPYAYEGAFAVRWLIQAQMQGDKELNYDAARGAVTAPVLLWGPYLWADGVNPRKRDGLLYVREDLAGDGTHPSDSGRQKVAELLLNFLVKDPLASTWFAK